MSESSGKDRHVLLVVSSLSAGGAERIISEMASWWASRHRKVTVLTLSGTDQDHYRLHPDVERIALNFWGRVRTPWQAIKKRVRRIMNLRAAVLSCGPDVVVSFMDTTNVRTLTALMGTGLPVIISERTDPRHNPISPFFLLARRLFYPFSAALVVQTRAVAQWARGVVSPDKVFVIPNFVRIPSGAAPSTRDASMILSVGRLSREKGHDLLLRAFAAAGGVQKGWRLVILGEGPERYALEQLAADLGLSGSVSLPGTVRDPAEWMRKTGIFVLPSRFEGFPNALLEAMACGCAVIAADCPSAPAAIIRHGEDGILVPTENVAALSDAMVHLMEDEGLRRRLGAEAPNVETTFSQDSVMGLWEALIENIMNKGDNA